MKKERFKKHLDILGIVMTNQLLALVQLCDSNFPSGAFSHSFGMETYIQKERIINAVTFSEALSTYVETQLTYTDGLACRLAYEFASEGHLQKIKELDQELYALALAKETREGTRRIGQRMVKLCVDLFGGKLLECYEQEIQRKECFGHPSIVFAIIAEQLQVCKQTAVSTHLYATVSSLIQNAVRGIPIGQTDGQRISLAFHEKIDQAVMNILQADSSELGAMMPGLEIAQMQHERLHVRLFMS